ncbi:MAG: hypothetical protein ABJP34_01085 [Erythrobacter sp.]
MSEDFDWIAASGKRAKGKRPEYFEDPALDRLYSVVMALVAEVSVLKDRSDTVERLLDKNGTISRGDIEKFVPDRAEGEERGLATRAYVARIMRGFQQEVEALEAGDPPIQDWVEKLSKD